VLFTLALIHALVDGRANRTQRLLMLWTLFVYGTLLEMDGVRNGHYFYPPEPFVNLGVVPLSVSLAWVGIIYSAMIIAGRLALPAWLRLLATALIALSLDWGMDPVATHIGAWVWRESGPYFGVPGFNMVGWFLIPICYSIAYGLVWDRSRRRLRLGEITEIDRDRSWGRRLYTALLVIPLAISMLIVSIRLMLRSPLVNLSWTVLVIWAILTVGGALALILWRRDRLRRTHWVDLLPPTVLVLIALAYTLFAFNAGRPLLALLMIGTALPLWTALGLSWRARTA